MLKQPSLMYRVVSFLIALCLVTPIFLWIPAKTNPYALIILFFLIAGLNWLLQRIMFPKLLRELEKYPAHWQWFILGLSFFAGLWLSLNIPLAVPPIERIPYLPPLFIRFTYRLFSAAGLGFVILLLSVSLAGIRTDIRHYDSRQFSFVKYFIFIILIWGLYLLALYPGMMSADSLVQWEQVLTGNYNDHHPVFHTLTIWLVTRIALTPTSVAIAQILFLGFVTAQWLAFFENIRVPQSVIWISAVLFTLSPVNGTMVNTLWKDVPYSTSILALSLLLSKIVFSNGNWLQTWKSKILLGVVTALVLLFRHDGLPVGIGTLIALFIFYPKKWKAWIITSAICFGLYFGIRGPLYQSIGVQKSTELAQHSLSLYTIAAYAKPDSQAEHLIESFTLISPNWDCRIGNKINPNWRSTDLDYSASPFKLLSNLAKRTPHVLIYFYRCARSMEWIVWDPKGEVRNPSHIEYLVDPNPYGIQHNSKIPWLRDILKNWVSNTSHNPDVNWFTWRPAFFLYIHLLVSMALIFRNTSLKFGLISLPIVIQSITFSLIFAAPNFRYHYAVYLVSLISWPLLFSMPQFMNHANKPSENL